MSRRSPKNRPVSPDPQYNSWLLRNYPDQSSLETMAADARNFAIRPLISIITPVFDPAPMHLRAALASVESQVYGEWELLLVDDGSTDGEVAEILREASVANSRLRLLRSNGNKGICRATASGLAEARGDFVTFLDHDDLLAPHALFRIVELLNQEPDVDVIYSDEDKICSDGIHRFPYFKPEWSPDSLTSRNYVGHLVVLRRSLVEAVGGIRPGFDGAQDYDLLLRATERTRVVRRVPDVLYHWRMHPKSTSQDPWAKPQAYFAARRALADFLIRRGKNAEVEEVAGFPGLFVPRYHVKEALLCSIIIPTKDKADLLANCLASVFSQTSYEAFEVIVIDNGSKDPATKTLLENWRKTEPKRFKVLTAPGPFNFSLLNNCAVRDAASGQLLLFPNNDTEIIEPTWLHKMIEHAQDSEIGVVGATLLYPDDTIQHAGIILGLGGTCAHGHRHQPADALGYGGWLKTVNNCLAVTGACLMCRRDVFESVGGFDESLPIDYNDVDFCLKVVAAGFRNVVLPHVRLYHHESASRKSMGALQHLRLAEAQAVLVSRWGDFLGQDPFYSPHLTRSREDFGIASESTDDVPARWRYDSHSGSRFGLRRWFGASVRFAIDEVAAPADRNFLYVSGWTAARRGGDPVTLRVYFEQRLLGETECAHSRPDVAKALRLPPESRPGFVFVCDDANLPQGGVVSLRFELVPSRRRSVSFDVEVPFGP